MFPARAAGGGGGGAGLWLCCTVWTREQQGTNSRLTRLVGNGVGRFDLPARGVALPHAARSVRPRTMVDYAQRKKQEALLAKLHAPDSVLEPGTVDAYEEFVAMGGDANEAHAAMANSFLGVAGMANDVAKWLRTAGGDPDETVKEVVGAHLTDGTFQVRTADQAFALMSASDAGPPAFINEVSRSPAYYEFVARLAARTAGSSALLEELRRRRSVTAGNASSVHSPEACVRAIVSAFEALMGKPVLQDADLVRFYEDCAVSATFDELTLVTWLRVLAEVGAKEEDPAVKALVRRCSQEIRVRAKAQAMKVANVAEHEALSFVTRLGVLIDSHAAGTMVPDGVLSDLWMVVSARGEGKTATKRAVENLTQLFAPLRPAAAAGGAGGDGGVVVAEGDDVVVEVSPIPDDRRAAHLGMLCEPEVMECMWRKLFTPPAGAAPGVKPDVDESVRDCMCMLLALASVHAEHRGDPSAPSSATLLPIDREAERKEVRALEDGLRKSVMICEDLYPGVMARRFVDPKCDPTRLQRLKAGIEQSPVIARGIVLWAREGLLRGNDPSVLVVSSLSYLYLLEAAAERYPLIRRDVVEIYADTYAHEMWSKTAAGRIPKMEMELRHNCGRALLSMLRLRCASHVVDLYRERFTCGDAIDLSYLRAFMTDLMGAITGPYSRPFITSVLRLLDAERMAAAFRNEEAVERRKHNKSKDGSGLFHIRQFFEEVAGAKGVEASLVNRVRAKYKL
jgi:hypothetical protein